MLDEPVASLDPLARREFLQSLMEAVADGGVTVVLSSHILSELERVCDHLVILTGGSVQLAGPIEEVLAAHRMLRGGRGAPLGLPDRASLIEQSRTERQTTVLARLDGAEPPDGWLAEEVGLEEIVLAYLGRPAPARDRALEEVAP